MATLATAYSTWKGNSGHRYRMKLEIRRTSVDTANNKSTVRMTMWMESDNSSFNISSTYSSRFSGTQPISNTTKNLSLARNSSLKVFEYSRTVTHNSSGNATPQASADFSNSFTGAHYALAKLSLNRIPQLPSKPKSAPTVSLDGRRFTVKSATASGNGGSITNYQIRRRNNASGSYSGWTTATGSTLTFTGAHPGANYQFESRAQTSAGWGPWSDTRTVKLPLQDHGIALVNFEFEEGNLRASWGVPSGAAPTGYEVQLRTGSTWGPVISTGTERSYLWTSLTPNTTYLARARALYANSSPEWVESDPVTLGSLPGQVRTLVMDDDGNFTWLPPTSLGGHALQGYNVRVWDGWYWTQPEFTEVPTYSIEESLPGVGYRAEVAAVTELGSGNTLLSNRYTNAACPCV